VTTLAPPSSIALAHLLQHTADMVQGVQEGRSLTELIARVPANARAGTQALSFEVLRRLGGAQAVRAVVANKAPPPAVDALLVSAIALLWPAAPGERAAYPDHTLVDQAVHAARQRAPAAAAFINAVLRRFVREREALVAAAERQPIGAYNHPLWWIERLKHDWPTQWQALLRQANQHPPMTLRVNARRGNAAAYVQRLAAQGMAAQAIGEHALVLAQPCAVTQLPGFAEGEVSVQDAAAQRAALLLGSGLKPRAHVLDACAAPGGKTAHLLELADLDLLALDSDASRLLRVQETLRRLHLSAATLAGDARQPATWWDGRPFDAILLDAPCSASSICAATPISVGCAGPAISTRWRASRRRCSMRCGRSWPPAGACSTPPARSSRPKGNSRSTLFCNASPRPRPGSTRPRPATCCPCRTMPRQESPMLIMSPTASSTP
jgi:16S rRNA (cytosine967-C5)-methyltransferase